MASPVEISIPTTTVSKDTSSPYTLYNITLRLPLRSFTIQKRYSDFVSLHTSLSQQTNLPPPSPLPPKSWLSNTVSNTTLREERRKGLEKYLRSINEAEDSRWRNCSAWRTFLNLPRAALSGTPSRASSLHAAVTGPGGAGAGAAPITDPTMWLDCHRDVKSHLHEARLHLTRRDQASTPQKQHECSAQAKSSLVRVGMLLGALEEGLKNISDRSGWSNGGEPVLREGELRRRKDLLAGAQKEKEGLENLLNAMATKSKLDTAVASIQDKQVLLGSGNSGRPKAGRVLGKETDQTRELDNHGVLQLQKDMMADQDLDVDELRKVVARQKELGIAIHNELELQNEMLNIVDEDADRVRQKVDVGRKRANKIS